MPSTHKHLALITLLLLVIVTAAGCRGFRRPMGAPTPTPATSQSSAVGKGWSLIPLKIAKTGAGDLRVDLAARNDTGTWSSMAASGKPATVTLKDGKEANCDTVLVGTGGHYVPAGFQLRGYSLKGDKTQTLYVECKGVDPANATRLSIPYGFVPGEYDYYAQEKTRVEAFLNVDLDLATPELSYPVAESGAFKAQALTEPIPALNKTTLTNAGATRSGDSVSFKWKVANPGEYDTKVHIGEPPLLGSDGIIYGVRVSPDIVDQPFATAKGEAEFETKVNVPAAVKDLYLLLSVEQSRERLFANYLIDLTGLK